MNQTVFKPLLCAFALVFIVTPALGSGFEPGLSKIFAELDLVPKSERVLADRGEIVFAITENETLELYFQKFPTSQASRNEFEEMKRDIAVPLAEGFESPIKVGEMVNWTKYGRRWSLLVKCNKFVFSLSGTDGESFKRGSQLAHALSEFFGSQK